MNKTTQDILSHMRVLEKPRKKYFDGKKKFPSKEEIKSVISGDTPITASFVNKFLSRNLYFDYEVLEKLLTPSLKKSRLTLSQMNQFLSMIKFGRTPAEQGDAYIKNLRSSGLKVMARYKNPEEMVLIEINHVVSGIDYLIRTVSIYFNALDDILDNIYDGIPEVSERSVKKVYAPYEKYFNAIDANSRFYSISEYDDPVRDAAIILIAKSTNTSIPESILKAFPGYDKYENLFNYLFPRNSIGRSGTYGTNVYRDKFCLIPVNPIIEFMRWIKEDDNYETTINHEVTTTFGNFSYVSVITGGMDRKLAEKGYSVDDKSFRGELALKDKERQRKKLMFWVFRKLLSYVKSLPDEIKLKPSNPSYLKAVDFVDISNETFVEATIYFMKKGHLKKLPKMKKLAYYLFHPTEYHKVTTMIEKGDAPNYYNITGAVDDYCEMSIKTWFKFHLENDLIETIREMIGSELSHYLCEIKSFYILREIGMVKGRYQSLETMVSRLEGFFGCSISKDIVEILFEGYGYLIEDASPDLRSRMVPQSVLNYPDYQYFHNYSKLKNDAKKVVMNNTSFIRKLDDYFSCISTTFKMYDLNTILQGLSLCDITSPVYMASMIQHYIISLYGKRADYNTPGVYTIDFVPHKMPEGFFFLQHFLDNSYVLLLNHRSISRLNSDSIFKEKIKSIFKKYIFTDKNILTFHKIEEESKRYLNTIICECVNKYW